MIVFQVVRNGRCWLVTSKLHWWVVPLLLLAAACQPTNTTANLPPTGMPFPTMTPGQVVSGVLPTGGAAPVSADGELANPATAVALANQPTPTPDYAQCPPQSSPLLDEQPLTNSAIINELERYLSAGGAVAGLTDRLRSEWAVFGDESDLRMDVDLTGEGVPEVIISYLSPDEGGVLAIFGCANGRYSARYQFTNGEAPPELIFLGDMTFDERPELLFSAETCPADDCAFDTRVVGWRADLGRFVNLASSIESETAPEAGDVDNDQVQEIIVRLRNSGTSETGPLRTGVLIYDWNGAGYVPSITQLDPPRYRIQIIHAADRLFADLDADQALPLYELALNDPSLDPWHSDEQITLDSYLFFRLLLAYAFVEDDRLLPTYQAMIERFPLDAETVPPFAELGDLFWTAFQITNNLNSACQEVQRGINQRPEMLDLLNRYGERSPTYSAQTVCPF